MFKVLSAFLECAKACKATGTGIANVFVVVALQSKIGDRVVVIRAPFVACHGVLTKTLPKWCIELVLIEAPDLDVWRDGLKTSTKLVFFETQSNALFELVNIAAV